LGLKFVSEHSHNNYFTVGIELIDHPELDVVGCASSRLLVFRVRRNGLALLASPED
jgi:hypothetical protein